jgi:hypothetical protein
MFTEALDNGFHVSTTCSSDSHGPVWGYERIPGNTVFMAKENTKEAYLDALLNHRAYACMSGNVKLRYCVNGHTAPATLPLSNHFRFQGEISYFYDDPETVIVGGEVISNGGVTVKELNFDDFSTFDFELDSDTSSWYYLRFWDKQGRKTWSVPVYTGREPYLPHNDDLTPLCKENMKVTDERTGQDVSVLGPYESSALARLYMLEVEHYMRLAVHLESNTFSEVTCIDHWCSPFYLVITCDLIILLHAHGFADNSEYIVHHD